MQRHVFRGVAARAVVAAAALVAAVVAFAQARPSLGERVARLEQLQAQAQASQQNVELLNRITELQSEVQGLRDLIETKAHTIDQLSERNRQQYLDLDGRLRRLETGLMPAASDAAGSGDTPTDGNADAGTAVVDAPAPPVPPANEAAPGVTADSAAGIAAGQPTAGIDASGGDPAAERSAYEQAFEALKNGQYADASRRFEAVLENWPDGAFAPNAQYWLGESYYVTQNYQLASESFSTLLERFPDSAKASDALLKLGYCQYELKQFMQAQATLKQVVERYPDSTVARLAQGRLRAMLLDNQ